MASGGGFGQGAARESLSHQGCSLLAPSPAADARITCIVNLSIVFLAPHTRRATPPGQRGRLVERERASAEQQTTALARGSATARAMLFLRRRGGQRGHEMGQQDSDHLIWRTGSPGCSRTRPARSPWQSMERGAAGASHHPGDGSQPPHVAPNRAWGARRAFLGGQCPRSRPRASPMSLTAAPTSHLRGALGAPNPGAEPLQTPFPALAARSETPSRA